MRIVHLLCLHWWAGLSLSLDLGLGLRLSTLLLERAIFHRFSVLPAHDDLRQPLSQLVLDLL